MTRDEKIRLARLIADAREMLAAPIPGTTAARWPAQVGRLETMLAMLCDCAEAFTPYTGSDQ